MILFVGLFYFLGCKETPNSEKNVDAVEPSSKNYTEIGSNYAKSTQKELGKNLMGAIKMEGTLGALEFCNVQAYPLTDSMAVVHRPKIKGFQINREILPIRRTTKNLDISNRSKKQSLPAARSIQL